jgi:hypothetical protein
VFLSKSTGSALILNFGIYLPLLGVFGMSPPLPPSPLLLFVRSSFAVMISFQMSQTKRDICLYNLGHQRLSLEYMVSSSPKEMGPLGGGSGEA